MWFIGVEVEQETSAPPPKKNPGSAPVERTYGNKNRGEFIDRTDRKRGRIVEKTKTSVDRHN